MSIKQRFPSVPDNKSSPDPATPDPTSLQEWGITPSGKSFPVPKTSDMMTSIFGLVLHMHPGALNVFDALTLFTMLVHFLVYVYGTQHGFLYIFLAWRAAYNVGLGLLLYFQSKAHLLVDQVRAFVAVAPAKCPQLYAFIVSQLERKMGPGYRFDKVPVEFNTWLIFRSLVDLILIHDFLSYTLFTVANWDTSSQFTWVDYLRLLGGILMIGFNLWVKLDAHRVVKDFAWYWGDFFFLLKNPSLTFDGVFELAPHPMYSVGYIGYYGAALITGSYTVLFVSLAAHTGQLVFLTFVENPHILKTYGQDRSLSQLLLSNPKYVQVFRSYFARDLIGINKNFDMYRGPDLFTVLLVGYAVVASWFGHPLFATCQAVFWMFIHTCVVGWILYKQSTSKLWTKHFIKFGATKKEAFEHWKQIYNLSVSMMYVSFVMASFKSYAVPSDWTLGRVLLRHTVGVLLILLNIWTSISVFDVLGDFGYFFGDFFIDRTELPIELFYTGIYRFVNNPEKLMGRAAILGIAIGSGSVTMIIIALFSYLANMVFLKVVEEPHMARLYGDKVRKESGVVKVVRSHMSPVVHRVRLSSKPSSPASERFASEEKPRSILEQISIKIISETNHVRVATRTLFDSQQRNYHEHLVVPKQHLLYQVSAVDVEYELGSPVSVKYSAPREAGPTRDWIGLYKLEDDEVASPRVRGSKSVLLFVTTVSSHGKWKYLTNSHTSGMPESTDLVSRGTVTFESGALPCVPGVYEARLHINDSRAVVAVSDPIRIVLGISVDPKAASEHDLMYLLNRSYKAVGMAVVVEHDLNNVPSDVIDRFVDLVFHVYQVEFSRLAMVQFGALAVVADRIREAQLSLSY